MIGCPHSKSMIFTLAAFCHSSIHLLEASVLPGMVDHVTLPFTARIQYSDLAGQSPVQNTVTREEGEVIIKTELHQKEEAPFLCSPLPTVPHFGPFGGGTCFRQVLIPTSRRPSAFPNLFIPRLSWGRRNTLLGVGQPSLLTIDLWVPAC